MVIRRVGWRSAIILVLHGTRRHLESGFGVRGFAVIGCVLRVLTGGLLIMEIW